MGSSKTLPPNAPRSVGGSRTGRQHGPAESDHSAAGRPDYALVAARDNQPAGGGAGCSALAMIIALFAVAALQTTRAAPALELERTELINRVQNAEREQDELQGRVTSHQENAASRGFGR